MSESQAPKPTPQLSAWTGSFGDAYVDRNGPAETGLRERVRGYSRILAATDGDPARSILECGCNLGLNLRALRRLTDAELMAVEPNARARARVLEDGVLPASHLHDATLSALPFPDASVDLVFTCGVLIHVPPEHIEQAAREVHRVARKYVLAVEYFSQKPTSAPYRGEDALMWKRDFGGLYLDLFPDLIPIDTGFMWKRTTGWDDANWWLFRKPGILR